MHCAAKNRRFVVLIAMIEAVGNPFIRNQHRQTTETLIKEIPSQSSNMVAEILAKIEELKNAVIRGELGEDGKDSISG